MTVGDIAQAAGLTRAALYFYFGSKHDVLAALVARTAQVLTEEAGLARTDSGSVDEVIAGAVERTAALWLAPRPGDENGRRPWYDRARHRADVVRGGRGIHRRDRPGPPALRCPVS
ncbi:MAG: helix-turn-helix domain containing protein [Mycobacterium kyogaense]|uniref:TetR/AcrR family transcriptional regulator n=1 Tax=Mycobacterium kyogaense TaxID=2212479 RepID=UPI002FF6402A